jgi:hypothetical protein
MPPPLELKLSVKPFLRWPNIKVLKDKALEFANSIRSFFATAAFSQNTTRSAFMAG